MRSEVIREMTLEEVTDMLNERHEQFTKLRLSHSVSPLENPLQLRQVRRDVARLRTELERRKNNQDA